MADDLEQAPGYEQQRGTICASCGRYVTLPPGKSCDAPEGHAEPLPPAGPTTATPAPAMVAAADLDYYRDELLRAHRTIGALQVQLDTAADQLEALRGHQAELERPLVLTEHDTRALLFAVLRALPGHQVNVDLQHLDDPQGVVLAEDHLGTDARTLRWAPR